MKVIANRPAIGAAPDPAQVPHSRQQEPKRNQPSHRADRARDPQHREPDQQRQANGQRQMGFGDADSRVGRPPDQTVDPGVIVEHAKLFVARIKRRIRRQPRQRAVHHVVAKGILLQTQRRPAKADDADQHGDQAPVRYCNITLTLHLADPSRASCICHDGASLK